MGRAGQDDEDGGASLLAELRQPAPPPEPEPSPPPPEAVVADWLTAIEAGDLGGDDARRRRTEASRALATLPTLAPFAARIEALLAAPQEPEYPHQLVRDLVCDGGHADDPALLALVDRLLTATAPRPAIVGGLAIAGALAAQSPRLAARIAWRARAERQITRRGRLNHDLIAYAVTQAGAPALLPTAKLEIDRHVPVSSAWGAAIGATGGVDGVAWIARRLGRAGWSDPLIAAVRKCREGEPLRRALLEHADPYLRIRAAQEGNDGDLRDRELAALQAAVVAAGWSRTLAHLAQPWRPPTAPLAPLPAPLTVVEALVSPLADARARAIAEVSISAPLSHAAVFAVAVQTQRAWCRLTNSRPPGVRLDSLVTSYQMAELAYVRDRQNAPRSLRLGGHMLLFIASCCAPLDRKWESVDVRKILAVGERLPALGLLWPPAFEALLQRGPEAVAAEWAADAAHATDERRELERAEREFIEAALPQGTEIVSDDS